MVVGGPTLPASLSRSNDSRRDAMPRTTKNALHSVERALVAAWPPSRWNDVSVVAAISGGADSTALLRALVAVRSAGPGRLVVAHYNHRLRGAAAEDDAEFVRHLARELDLECVVGLAAGASEVRRGAGAASEEHLRDQRHAFLRDTARRLGARYIALAHTADDQAETILHHACRGTGLRGLRGMPRYRAVADGLSLVRPLLDVGRAELREYLAALRQPFREDGSNLDRRYTRNRIRHEVLSLLESAVHPGAVAALARLGRQAAEAQEALDRLATEALESATLDAPAGTVAIDCTRLARWPALVVREALRLAWRRQAWPQQGMGERQWRRLAEFVGRPEKQAQVLHGNVVAARVADRLTLSRRS
jgi:tRNA(Ile)-lysidine synthase